VPTSTREKRVSKKKKKKKKRQRALKKVKDWGGATKKGWCKGRGGNNFGCTKRGLEKRPTQRTN